MIGRNGPKLKAANNNVFSFSVETFCPAYTFPMWAYDFNTVPLINEGLASEINTGTFNRSASGSATPRGRNIMNYGGTTTSLSVGVNMTGPNTAIVVGVSSNWMWSPGPTHPTTTDTHNAEMCVNVSDSCGTQCAGCGNYYDPNNLAQAAKHSLQASCEKKNENGIQCDVSSFWGCEDPPHECDFGEGSGSGG